MTSTVYRGAVIALSTTVVLPYAVAILCNFLYGWPIEEKKYRRALDPKKVYAVNWHVLKQLLYLKYTSFFLRAKYLYYTAGENRLIKDVSFGSSNNDLDLYFPTSSGANNGACPVVVFVYGGGWSSGDKSIYSSVCCQLADRLNAVVACPNYSIYPKGYVDDMIQDVVDCVAWIHDNIDQYGGKGDHIMLIGHSAGAHLCIMAVLELYKQLPAELHDVFLRRVTPRSVTPRHTPKSVSPHLSDPFVFDEHHYEGGNANDAGRHGSGSESFVVLSESQNTQSLNNELLEASLGASLQGFNVITAPAPLNVITQPTGDNMEPTSSGNQQPLLSDSSGSSVQVVELNGGKEAEEHGETTESVSDYRPRSHVACMMQSIRAVIGIAGVYDVGEQYHYYYEQGIEDIKALGRCSYGPEHFHRFSPVQIVQDLPSNSCLPHIVLLHGTNDSIVPITSSTLFVDTVHRNLPEQPIDFKVLPGCGHVDVCLDIGSPTRKYHDQVINCILQCAHRVF